MSYLSRCIPDRLLGTAFACLAVLCAALAPAGAAVPDAPRRALVIGNSSYKAITKLNNAEADGQKIAETLSKLNFEVDRYSNVSKSEFEKALIAFRNKITPGSIVVIYFAGHGLQVNDENYVVPVDAEIGDANDLPLVALSARQILDQVSKTEANTIVFILDACRDNPFKDASGKTRSINGQVTRGLARLSSERAGTLIAFSTSPGAVAQDGTGRQSPYSEALAAALQVPGISIEEVFKRTRADVKRRTGGAQLPWENSSLIDDVVLIPRPLKEEVAIDRCDLLAAHPTDPQRVGNGVDYPNLDTGAAIPACEDAVAKHPDQPRFKMLLGRALEKAGRGEEAMKWNQESMQQGYLAAWHNMGNLYKKGVGVPQDQAIAFKYFSYAADKGHKEDQYNIGYMYLTGQGVQTDYKAALDWLKKSAEQNFPAALDKIGLMYLNGNGVEKDPAKALKYFEQAANLGDPFALINYGDCFKNGTGTKPDFAKARDLFMRAARMGQTAAYVNLGNLANEGKGGRRDLVEAAFWYSLGAREGHEFARTQLEQISASLSPQDRAAVARKVGDWDRKAKFG